MARRSKTKRLEHEEAASKGNIISLLEAREKQKRPLRRQRNLGDLNTKISSISMSEEFQTIFNKYNGTYCQPTMFRPDETDRKQDNKRTYTQARTEGSQFTVSDGTDNITLPQKKRKRSKPTLVELKSKVKYPQLVEWFDCDAPDSEILVKIKTSKNVVGVPGHWQNKREYLSGRSLLEKRPFTLPDVIKLTGIEQLRPNDAEETKSLKEISRNTVRPKMRTLDLDFQKIYDSLFKVGAGWKPSLLLGFGDLYYEGRILANEINWKEMVKNYRPGVISEKLRIALNLHEGQPPYWIAKIKEVGLPPSYPDFKIAGVNCDMSNARGSTYGKRRKVYGKDSSEYKRFGRVLIVNRPHQESEENKHKNNDIESNAAKNEIISELEVHTDKEMIHPIAYTEKSIANDDTVTESHSLYTVLEEKTLTDENIGLRRKRYNLSNKVGTIVDERSGSRVGSEVITDNTTKKDSDVGGQDTIENFKF